MSTDNQPRHKYSTTSPTGLTRDEVGYPIGEGLNKPFHYWPNCNRWIEADEDHPRPSHHVIGGTDEDRDDRWDERMPWWADSPLEAFEDAIEVTELKRSVFQQPGHAPPDQVFLYGEESREHGERYAALMIVMENCWVTTYRVAPSIFPKRIKDYLWGLLRDNGYFGP